MEGKNSILIHDFWFRYNKHSRLPMMYVTAVLRHLLCKKNEPELSLHFLVTSYDGQGHVYKRKIIRGADLEKTYI